MFGTFLLFFQLNSKKDFSHPRGKISANVHASLWPFKIKLYFSEMNIHDGGEYSCEVETDDAEPTAVVHTVEILGEFYWVLSWITIFSFCFIA